MTDEKPKSGVEARQRKPRGFAALDPDRQREISKLGGKRAHETGTAHEFTADEARSAGRKGGLATQRKQRGERVSGGRPPSPPENAADEEHPGRREP